MRRFTVVWLGFLVIAAAAAVLQWIVVSLFYGMLLDVRAFLFQGVLTVAVEPAPGAGEMDRGGAGRAARFRGEPLHSRGRARDGLFDPKRVPFGAIIILSIGDGRFQGFRHPIS